MDINYLILECIKPEIYVLKRHVVWHVTVRPLLGCRTLLQEVKRRPLKVDA
jgi:hypothetical protein